MREGDERSVGGECALWFRQNDGLEGERVWRAWRPRGGSRGRISRRGVSGRDGRHRFAGSVRRRSCWAGLGWADTSYRATQSPGRRGQTMRPGAKIEWHRACVPSADKPPATTSSQQAGPARLRFPAAEPTRPRAPPSSRGAIRSLDGFLSSPCVPRYGGGAYSTWSGAGRHVMASVVNTWDLDTRSCFLWYRPWRGTRNGLPARHRRRRLTVINTTNIIETICLFRLLAFFLSFLFSPAF